MPFIKPDFIESLKLSVTLSDIIRRYVDLKKSGHQWVGLSPFKSEKTPSFFVNDDKNFYHCFATNKHGDAISFLMEVENLSFSEAIEKIAHLSGITVEYEKTEFEKKNKVENKDNYKLYYDILTLAMEFYHNNLKNSNNSNLRQFLVQRKITTNEINYFKLGLAGNENDSLIKYFQAKNISVNMLEKLGLVINSNNNIFDRFRNRVIFPIFDRQNRVIAFGGRTIDKNDKIKYLNSPTNILFKKNRNLYNLQNCSFRDNDIFLVEGYMDALSLSKFGFTNVVAPLGTAIGEEQLKIILSKYAHINVIFDGDEAGINASFRLANIILPLLRAGKIIRFIFLPDRMDPDDYLHTYGKEKFSELITHANSLSDILYKSIIKEINLDERAIWRAEEKALLLQNIKKSLALIQDEELRHFLRSEIKEKFSNSEYIQSISKNNNNPKKSFGTSYKKSKNNFTNIYLDKKNNENFSIFELLLLNIIFKYPYLIIDNYENLINFPYESEKKKAFFYQIFDFIIENGKKIEDYRDKSDFQVEKCNENIENSNDKLYIYLVELLHSEFPSEKLTNIINHQSLSSLLPKFIDKDEARKNFEYLLIDRIYHKELMSDIADYSKKAVIDKKFEDKWRQALSKSWHLDNERKKF